MNKDKVIGQFTGKSGIEKALKRFYYARFRINGKLIHRSLNAAGREFAKRRLKEEITQVPCCHF